MGRVEFDQAENQIPPTWVRLTRSKAQLLVHGNKRIRHLAQMTGQLPYPRAKLQVQIPS